MPVFGANVPCTIFKLKGHDQYGAPVFGSPKKVKCAVARLANTSKDTTVRADSSGTRGHAKEEVADAKLLFHKNTDIELGDKLVLPYQTLWVTTVIPRYTVWSVLDHFEVFGAINHE